MKAKYVALVIASAVAATYVITVGMHKTTLTPTASVTSANVSTASISTTNTATEKTIQIADAPATSSASINQQTINQSSLPDALALAVVTKNNKTLVKSSIAEQALAHPYFKDNLYSIVATTEQGIGNNTSLQTALNSSQVFTHPMGTCSDSYCVLSGNYDLAKADMVEPELQQILSSISSGGAVIYGYFGDNKDEVRLYVNYAAEGITP